MKSALASFSLLFLTLILLNQCTRQSDFPELTGPYLGQTPPGKTPEVFAPGIISHGFHEHSLTFSPDSRHLLFVTTDARYSLYRIVWLSLTGRTWTTPRRAPFSSDYSDLCPQFSPDGNRLYFASNRPVPGQSKGEDLSRIWVVDKTGDTYGMAKYLEIPVPPEADIANPSQAANGTLYYQYSHGDQGWDLYRSRYTNGLYSEPENLGALINTPYNESAPFISPDENFLLFHSNRPGGSGGMDIYVSFRQPDGSWGPPVNLGPNVNSPASDWKPVLSPDGKYLFFSSYRGLESDIYRGKSYPQLVDLYRHPQNGTGTLFWVDTDIITDLQDAGSN